MESELSTQELNKDVFRRAVNVWQSGHLEAMDDLVADDYVGHVAKGDRDVAGLKERIREFRIQFPRMVLTVHEQLAQGDRVASRLSAEGTDAKTGDLIRMVGMNFSRFSDGRIQEEWAAWEMMRQ